MKRLVLMFLMLMLPLQFSWAGVSAYCQHETSAAAVDVPPLRHERQQRGIHDELLVGV